MMVTKLKWRVFNTPLMIAALIGLLALSACGDDGPAADPAAADPMEMSRSYQALNEPYYIGKGVRLVSPESRGKTMKVASNVYQIPGELKDRVTVADNQLRIAERGAPYLKNRQVGDIIISPQMKLKWRRIKSIERIDGEVIWHTEAAQLTEVFEDAHFFMQVDLRKVDPKDIPHIDLAMPYMEPHTPPRLHRTQRQAAGSSCPQAPTCRASTDFGDKLCVLKANPGMLCPFLEPGKTEGCDEIPDELMGGCKVRNANECYVTGTDDICPENDRDSCDSAGGACERRSFYVGNIDRAVNIYSSYPPQTVLTEAHCEEIAGYQRLVIRSCQQPSVCNPEGMDENDPAGNYCKKVTDPFPGGPAQCTSGGETCSANTDCCSQNCAAVKDENGQVIARRCAESQVGYCIAMCEDKKTTEEQSDHEAAKTGGRLKDLLGADFIEDLDVAAKFKPAITFEVKVNLTGVKLFKLTVGADFYFHLAMKFKFEHDFSKKVEKEATFVLFGFAIMGYPFTVNLDLHAMAMLSAAIEGTFEPKFGFYTYRSDKKWTEEINGMGPFAERPLPFFEDDAGGSGIEVGFAYAKSNPCGNYKPDDCEKLSGKWYGIKKFDTDRFFDPGLQAELDVNMAAEIGAGVGLYDGVSQSRLIGLEPVNLLARAFARVQQGYCGLGFNVYYRAFLIAGPIEIFGMTLIPKLNIPIITKHMKDISFSYRIPDNLPYDCEGDGQDKLLCQLSDQLECGFSSPEPIIPAAEGAACTQHAECAEASHRCIDQKCLDIQPPGSLRMTLNWTDFKDLNLQIRTPDDQVITRNTHPDLFAGTCSNPLNPGSTEAQQQCDSTHLYGETLTLQADAGNGQLPKGVYLITVTSAAPAGTGAQLDSDPIGFSLEIEEEGLGAQTIQGQFVQGGAVEKVPVSFEYEVK